MGCFLKLCRRISLYGSIKCLFINARPEQILDIFQIHILWFEDLIFFLDLVKTYLKNHNLLLILLCMINHLFHNLLWFIIRFLIFNKEVYTDSKNLWGIAKRIDRVQTGAGWLLLKSMVSKAEKCKV